MAFYLTNVSICGFSLDHKRIGLICEMHCSGGISDEISLETLPYSSLSVHYALEVARFLRNRGSQFLFLGNHATRIGG